MKFLSALTFLLVQISFDGSSQNLSDILKACPFWNSLSPRSHQLIGKYLKSSCDDFAQFFGFSHCVRYVETDRQGRGVYDYI